MNAIILRGLPGSGKSTWAKRKKASVVSADQFFERNGRYSFDSAQLHDAHIWCFTQFLRLLKKGQSVIIDNTNTTAVEIAPYALAAESFGYNVEIHEFRIDIDTAAERNTHGVPKATIRRMARQLEEPLPRWWKIVRH